MLVSIVYYKIKSINSLMGGKKTVICKYFRQVGKAVTPLASENASPERCCLQMPDCTYRGSSRCCVISRIQS